MTILGRLPGLFTTAACYKAVHCQGVGANILPAFGILKLLTCSRLPPLSVTQNKRSWLFLPYPTSLSSEQVVIQSQ